MEDFFFISVLCEGGAECSIIYFSKIFFTDCPEGEKICSAEIFFVNSFLPMIVLGYVPVEDALLLYFAPLRLTSLRKYQNKHIFEQLECEMAK